MRRYAALALALIACSDKATEPESHEIEPGTYTLLLEGCLSCPFTSTPGYALQFLAGIKTTVVVSDVSDEEATGEVTWFAGTAPSSLFGGPVEMRYSDRHLDGDGGYLGTWDFSAGALNLTIGRDGCDVFLLYPGVDFGDGSCEVQREGWSASQHSRSVRRHP